MNDENLPAGIFIGLDAKLDWEKSSEIEGQSDKIEGLCRGEIQIP
jgi:hypothetical protein